MPRITLRRKIASLVFAMALAVPWAAAAAPPAWHQTAGPDLLHQLWATLTGLWGAGVPLDSGCKMDPDGRCLPGSAAPAPAITPDDGCMMDPNGRCGMGS